MPYVSYAVLLASEGGGLIKLSCAGLEALGTRPQPRSLAEASHTSPKLEYFAYHLASIISLFVIFNVMFIPGVQILLKLVIRICAIFLINYNINSYNG